jgi:hypothetical protein
MGPTASTIIALSSLALAALTVLVSYLNVRRQADAAMELEHVKWLREKRDEVYGLILAVLDRRNWDPIPGPEDERWTDLDEVGALALRYASDAVLAEMQTLVEYRRSLRSRQGVSEIPVLTAKEARATTNLGRRIREELAGKREATKTWRRYDKKWRRHDLRE